MSSKQIKRKGNSIQIRINSPTFVLRGPMGLGWVERGASSVRSRKLEYSITKTAPKSATDDQVLYKSDASVIPLLVLSLI